jgi:predicted GNAT superfamily acetyltransferase
MSSFTAIRALKTLEEMQAAVELQRNYWGSDAESVVPAHMLFSLASYGGHVLAAFDGDKMVGVLIGFLGTAGDEPHRPAMANLQIVSKRMVVLPEYRGQGIGYKLKKRQREIALRQGIRLITWTFDPLLATNAHLNIRKLGAIVNIYLEDYYGTTVESGLSKFGSSDRLLAEWWVTNRRVEERLNGNRPEIDLNQYLEAGTPIANPSVLNLAGYAIAGENILDPVGSLVLLEIPVNYESLAKYDGDQATIWRRQTRLLFQQLFATSFVITDFVRQEHEGRDRAFYLLSQTDKVFERIDFSRN